LHSSSFPPLKIVYPFSLYITSGPVSSSAGASAPSDEPVILSNLAKLYLRKSFSVIFGEFFN